MNVIEIDAASNNGVENIRQIREEVSYSPTQGKYKVYIIDEVHMLSIGAFNALLKTLEEPPSYVIFILATTESHKIPITILSRCQKYDFRRISIETISARLMDLSGAGRRRSRGKSSPLCGESRRRFHARCLESAGSVYRILSGRTADLRPCAGSAWCSGYRSVQPFACVLFWQMI